jgi:Spy/CpxP family protein refolding chaperone
MQWEGFWRGLDFQRVSDTSPAGTFHRISKLNDTAGRAVSGSTMTKLIALVAAGAFAAGTMFAGEHGDCARKAGNDGKMACTASLASLNLTPDQKTKMDTAMAEHHKAGCNEATEAKFMKDAQGILTPEQFAKFKAECSKKEKAGA